MKTVTLFLATSNRGKQAEIQAFFTAKQSEAPALHEDLSIEVRLLDTLPEVEENGQTFAENALLKAQAALQPLRTLLETESVKGQALVLAEDAGLIVPVLSGCYGLSPFPGVQSKRWCTSEICKTLLGGLRASNLSVNDADRNVCLLKLLEAYPDQREAAYVSAMTVLSAQTGQVVCTVQAQASLWVTLGQARGTQGFGYDPIMQPVLDGVNMPEIMPKTMAECSTELKNQLSHRGKALQQVWRALQEMN